MNKLISGLLAGLMISVTLICSGCGGGCATTYAERQREWKRTQWVGQRQLADDIDAVLHSDRPSRLSPYYTR